MTAKYAFYAHLEAPIYQHLEQIAGHTNQSKGYVVSEALKRLHPSDVPSKPKKSPVSEGGPSSGWSLPVDIFRN